MIVNGLDPLYSLNWLIVGQVGHHTRISCIDSNLHVSCVSEIMIKDYSGRANPQCQKSLVIHCVAICRMGVRNKSL